MKTTNMKHIVAVALLALTATTAQAKSWRINNDATKAPDFTSINAAMSSTSGVADGDTLYLDPGTNLSDAQTVSKNVTVVGVGFSGSRPYSYATISGKVTITAANATLLALNITGQVSINAQHVTLERCNVTNRVYSSGSSCQFATFRQCFIHWGANGSYNRMLYGQGKTSNNTAFWTIENSILDTWSYGQCITELYSATIRNNLIINWDNSYTIQSIGNSTIINNIIINRTNINYTISDCDGIFTNNVISQNYNSSTNHVTNSTSLAAVYTGGSQTYTLIEDSPAAGYGTDGKDCGIFGGLYPYVADGLPAGHPFYEKAVISPRAENDKVNVSLKIKMQNE